jgi:protease IV
MKDYSRFISELSTGRFFIQEGALDKYLPYIFSLNQGRVLEFPDLPKLKASIFDQMGLPVPDTEKEIEEGVAVIPISGVLTRSGSWWDYGTEELADIINEAMQNPSISALVLKENCFGGSTDAIFPIKESIANRTKKIICAVDSNSYSLGYYISALCDKVIAVDNMAQVGSIGVMATYIDWDKSYEQYGGKKYEVYPPESDWKNKSIRDLKAGNDKTIIKEELSPWAQHFQDVVRANRKSLNEDIVGTLNGRTFFANYGDVNAKLNGLIDDVMPMNDIIQYAFNLAKISKAKSLFNN